MFHYGTEALNLFTIDECYLQIRLIEKRLANLEALHIRANVWSKKKKEDRKSALDLLNKKLQVRLVTQAEADKQADKDKESTELFFEKFPHLRR